MLTGKHYGDKLLHQVDSRRRNKYPYYFIPRVLKECFGNLNKCGIDDFLVDHELSCADLIHFMSKTRSNEKCCSDYQETDSFTSKHLYEALQLAKKLENFIIDIDSNIQRSLKKFNKI